MRRFENTINFKIGFLLQPQADWTLDAVTGGYQQNVCIRWVQPTSKVTVFFETDNPQSRQDREWNEEHLEQRSPRNDAYLEWKASDAFALNAGLMFIPL